MNKISLSFLLAACVSATVGATPIEVSSVAQLMSAVSNAEAGDEIVIKSSGSPYEFSSTDFDTYAHLYARVKITLRGETGNPDDVVLVGNDKRILYLSQISNIIRDLTFRNGNATGYAQGKNGGAIVSAKAQDFTSVISNCVFESSQAAIGGACACWKVNDSYFGKYIRCSFIDNSANGTGGGALHNAYSVENCIFRNNRATSASSNGGAVSGAAEIVGSIFEGNALTDDGNNSACGGGAVYLPTNDRYDLTTISNCTFTANSTLKQHGGAIRAAENAGLAVVDCVFNGNSTTAGYGGAAYGIPSIVDCVLSNNCTTSGFGGALASVPSVMGCTIVSNATSSSNGFGGGVYDCTLTGCYLSSNYAYRCGAAADSRLYACTNASNKAGDFYEFGPATGGWGCYAEDCVFDGVGASNKRVFGSTGFNRCRFANVSAGSRLFTTYVAMTNSLVANCQSNFTLLYNLSEPSDWINCTIVSNVYTLVAGSGNSNVLIVENCFLYDNKIGSDYVDIDNTAYSVVSSFNSCILSAASDGYISGSNNLNYYGSANFKPGFVGIELDQENPYAITTRSPAYKKDGVVEGWMATATDIRGEGFPRLRDGLVNIGCYQCWDKEPGLTIVFR